MSFEKINRQEAEVFYEKSCIIVYYFNAQEIRQIQNAARLSGIRECLVVAPQQSGNLIKDILQGELKNTGEGSKHKVIIFNGIQPTRMNAFIEALKKCRLARPLMAVTTETSIHWTIDELIGHLLQERKAIREGRFENH